MKKAPGILATVALIGATAITAPAPAEARGIGPGLAFGLAAGAIAAGAAASVWALLLRPGLWVLRSELLLRTGPLRLLRRRTVLSAPLLSSLVTRKARSLAPGFFFCESELQLTRRAAGRIRPTRSTAWRRNIPRARVRIFPASPGSLRRVTRFPRARASRSCLSVIAHPF